MNRGIDHLVLGVHALHKARDTYARLGFTTTPRAIHPFGTGNSLVQLQGNFLELLTVVDESKFAAPAAGGGALAASRSSSCMVCACLAGWYSEIGIAKSRGRPACRTSTARSAHDLAALAMLGSGGFQLSNVSRSVRRVRISLCGSSAHAASCADRSSTWSRASGCSTVVKKRQRGSAAGEGEPS